MGNHRVPGSRIGSVTIVLANSGCLKTVKQMLRGKPLLFYSAPR